MADTLCVKDARFSLLSKETYNLIRTEQKSLLPTAFKAINEQYQTSLNAWYSARPEAKQGLFGKSKEEIEWQQNRPIAPTVLSIDARSLNIIYGMLRGHVYRDIEKKYRKGNGPARRSIETLLRHFDIDIVEFYRICGDIDYEE